MNHNHLVVSPQQLSDYQVLWHKNIGSGVYSNVYKAINHKTGKEVAVKVIDLAKQDEASRNLLQNECKILGSINHEYVLKMIEIIFNETHCYIFTQLIDGQLLGDFMNHGEYSNEQTLLLFSKIVQGMQYLLDNNILHRDIKPSNIIIRSNRQPVIIDFGFSQLIDANSLQRVYNVGSPSYMSPEAYLKTLYSQKSQSWALGVLLFEMFHKNTPDIGKSIRSHFQLIKNDQQYINKLITRNIPLVAKDIIVNSLKYNAFERMSLPKMKYLFDVYLRTNHLVTPNKISHSTSMSNNLKIPISRSQVRINYSSNNKIPTHIPKILTSNSQTINNSFNEIRSVEAISNAQNHIHQKFITQKQLPSNSNGDSNIRHKTHSDNQSKMLIRSTFQILPKHPPLKSERPPFPCNHPLPTNHHHRSNTHQQLNYASEFKTEHVEKKHIGTYFLNKIKKGVFEQKINSIEKGSRYKIQQTIKIM